MPPISSPRAPHHARRKAARPSKVHARDFFARISVFASPASPANPLRIWEKSSSAGKTAPEPTKYHEWNLIEETVANAAGVIGEVKRYVWGNDLSGSLDGAGGVGGLLSMSHLTPATSTPDTYFYAFDGNGNVRALVKADAANPSLSAMVEKYAYDGFGREIIAPPSISRLNSFAFSTKYWDVETGMNYYGYRYYAAGDGRWINRDPMEEGGGLNVYSMIDNHSVNNFDVLGNSENSKDGWMDLLKEALDSALGALDRSMDGQLNDNPSGLELDSPSYCLATCRAQYAANIIKINAVYTVTQTSMIEAIKKKPSIPGGLATAWATKKLLEKVVELGDKALKVYDDCTAKCEKCHKGKPYDGTYDPFVP